MEFVGNDKAVNFVNKVIEKKFFSQAYLFSGPEAVGKFFLGKSFAKSLILGGKLSFDFNEQLMDLIVVRPQVEEKKGIIKERDITIEQVREAQGNLALFPYHGQRKVLIIDNAHKMNIASQNAFLKLLEEPNSTSVIILITHEESKILPTIKSRCQKINFGLVPVAELEKNSIGVQGEKCALLSMGRPGLFFDLMNSNEKLEFYENAYVDFGKINSLDLNQKLSYAEKLSKNIKNTIETLNVWIWILRGKSRDNTDNINFFYKQIEAIENAITILKNTNANSRLVLENLFINM